MGHHIDVGISGQTQSRVDTVDWARWTTYGDTAARNRLPSDASGSEIK
ncbi:hypothetical protein [Lentzea aerocolonigenes]|nr:hypothetical protein [Lentzea aerocolonigenes]